MASNRSAYVSFRVSPGEHKTLSKTAKKAGLSISEYARQRTLGEKAESPYTALSVRLDELEGTLESRVEKAVREATQALGDD